MLKMVRKIIQYPRLTQNYPDKSRLRVDRFVGKPVIDISKCTRCGECASRCPSRAIVLNRESNDIGINYDECIYCMLCEEVCQTRAAKMTNDFEFAEKNRNRLRKSPLPEDSGVSEVSHEELCNKLERNIKKTLGRSLYIREVDSGSCNGCDYEINGMNNPLNDIERFGIHFVASPRHADMLLVTGTAVRNMQNALLKTFNATPDPKVVVAVGACACSGGIFRDCYAANSGIDSLVPVDLYIPGCPPRPQAIMYGILKVLDRIKG
ncbi:MAG: NADH-quinone oxidoreductase subunit NuoB [Clostridia bacterium]|nr:NADH-quinone oxidoreductase subunit NuoB [Clostridia bacterium]